MKTEDREAFAVAMGSLCVAHGVAASPELLKVYWADLRDLPVDAVLAAITELRRTSDRFPKIAHLRQWVEDRSATSGADAWSDCLSLARDWRSARHPDPMIERVIADLGGWRHLATMPERELHAFVAKRFSERYLEARQKRDEARRLGAPDPFAAQRLPAGAAGALIEATAAGLGVADE